MSHSPEPWQIHNAGDVFGRYRHFHCRDETGIGSTITEADAARIVACVNFCRHLPPSFLELHFASEQQPDMDQSRRAMTESLRPDVSSHEEFMGWVAVSSDKYTRPKDEWCEICQRHHPEGDMTCDARLERP